MPYLRQPVIVEAGAFLLALEELRKEFEKRVQALRNGVPVSRIVVVADEYSDLMVADGDKANSVLANMLVLGRSAGVHFIFATSRPDEVVMSAPLRCGFPGRIAFKVAFEWDSRMIIDENGADRLNGRGDFLFRDSTSLHRGQVPYISAVDFESSCAHGHGQTNLLNYRQRQERHHERTHQKTPAEASPSRCARRRCRPCIRMQALRKGVYGHSHGGTEYLH